MRASAMATMVVASLCATPALAQSPGDFVIQPDTLLAANSGGNGYMVNGIGSPAVVYDTDQDRLLMVFEVNLPVGDPECPYGRWGLGMAVSDDGLNWTALAQPILNPRIGEYYGCVAAHPTAIYGLGDHIISIWFKAEQTDPPDLAIGPDRFVGVGRMRVKFKAGGGIEGIIVDSTPALQVDQNLGYPKVIKKGSGFEMMLTLRPHVYMATSTSQTGFVLDPTPVLDPADQAFSTWWSEDEFFNASLVCEDDPVFPYSVFVGGRTLSPGAVIDAGGWGKAISSNTDSWFLNVDPFFDWTGEADWRHWDVVRHGTSDYMAFFSEKDGNNQNRIRLASTVDPWTLSDIYNKNCP